ncbi:30S ribosomal protein S18 [Candidatus Gottesmanbacteria bacterium]|nr:30S ribosomal protein S18 [Candidatus Gottesmanbacteria bacterium]
MVLRKIRLRPVPRNCIFCNETKEPDFHDLETLRRFVSERGKILSHQRTGICSKHQRKIALEIKRARFLGLLPFINRS